MYTYIQELVYTYVFPCCVAGRATPNNNDTVTMSTPHTQESFLELSFSKRYKGP